MGVPPRRCDHPDAALTPCPWRGRGLGSRVPLTGAMPAANHALIHRTRDGCFPTRQTPLTVGLALCVLGQPLERLSPDLPDPLTGAWQQLNDPIIPSAPQDGAHQRAIILQHLRQHGEISTIEARERYGIMSPASRVLELRRAGHRIDTVRFRAPDANGQFHNQAKYVMRGVK